MQRVCLLLLQVSLCCTFVATVLATPDARVLFTDNAVGAFVQQPTEALSLDDVTHILASSLGFEASPQAHQLPLPQTALVVGLSGVSSVPTTLFQRPTSVLNLDAETHANLADRFADEFRGRALTLAFSSDASQASFFAPHSLLGPDSPGNSVCVAATSRGDIHSVSGLPSDLPRSFEQLLDAAREGLCSTDALRCVQDSILLDVPGETAVNLMDPLYRPLLVELLFAQALPAWLKRQPQSIRPSLIALSFSSLNTLQGQSKAEAQMLEALLQFSIRQLLGSMDELCPNRLVSAVAVTTRQAWSESGPVAFIELDSHKEDTEADNGYPARKYQIILWLSLLMAAAVVAGAATMLTVDFSRDAMLVSKFNPWMDKKKQ